MGYLKEIILYDKVWQLLTRGSLRLIDVNSVIFYDKNPNFNRWIYNFTVSL